MSERRKDESSRNDTGSNHGGEASHHHPAFKKSMMKTGHRFAARRLADAAKQSRQINQSGKSPKQQE
jgi:hypothetical protein